MLLKHKASPLWLDRSLFRDPTRKLFRFWETFQILGNFSDFRKLFRFSETFQIFRKFSKKIQIFGKFSDFWKFFRFWETFQILGIFFRFWENIQIFRKYSDFPKIFRFSENVQNTNTNTQKHKYTKNTNTSHKRTQIQFVSWNLTSSVFLVRIFLGHNFIPESHCALLCWSRVSRVPNTKENEFNS